MSSREYQRQYRLKNKDKMKAYMREYSLTPKFIETHKKYHKENVTTKFDKYWGVCICPKCGEKGYLRTRRGYNTKTKVFYPPLFVVQHQHKEKGKTVFDNDCYIGAKFR